MTCQNFERGMQLEQAILAILIVDHPKMKECEIDPEIFADYTNRSLYRTMKSIVADKGELDLMELFARMQSVPGADDYVLRLQDIYISSASLYTYIDDLQEIYKVRKADEIMKGMSDGKLSFDEALQQMNGISAQFVSDSTATMLSAKDIRDLVTRCATKLRFSRFRWLQEKVGFIEKTVNVIAARPSVGKSAFALNLMNDLAQNYRCLYLNMEMTEQEIYQRLTAINSHLSIEAMKRADEDTKISNQLNSGINVLRSRNIRIYNGSKTVNGIRKIVARESRKGHCIVFVDYIGYVTTGRRQDDRERIGEAVRQLQIMTKDYDCTMFILAQINRTGEDKPSMSSLKDSGEIEQTAHALIILHDVKHDPADMHPLYQLRIEKNRSGEKGIFKTVFHKPTQIFDAVREK